MKQDQIYDYLAKIYLDKTKKKDNKNVVFRYSLFVIPVIIVTGLAFALLNRPKDVFLRAENESLSLAGANEHIKINYNFLKSSLKKEGYTLNLANLDVRDFKMLSFNARSLKPSTAKLRVELENSFKESGYVYLPIDSTKWKEYLVNLSDFIGISNWRKIQRVSFIIEEWNAGSKDGVLYIDGIKFKSKNK